MMEKNCQGGTCTILIAQYAIWQASLCYGLMVPVGQSDAGGGPHGAS